MEDEDFLPDEFVTDDVPDLEHVSTVTFAGPSDPPPRHPIHPVEPRTNPGRKPYVLALGLGLAAAAAAITGMTRAPGASLPTVQAAGTLAPAPSVAPVPLPVEAPVASVAAAAPATSTSATPAPVDEAAGALREATKALEKNHAAEAIDAGERAVALDPSNAQAWLVLGGAYDEKGKYGEARRCFTTCVRVATRGPRTDCAALIR